MTDTTQLPAWEASWAQLCTALSEGFDVFSSKQRFGIAGTMEIEGKTFIRYLIATERLKWHKEVLLILEQIAKQEDRATERGDENERNGYAGAYAIVKLLLTPPQKDTI